MQIQASDELSRAPTRHRTRLLLVVLALVVALTSLVSRGPAPAAARSFSDPDDSGIVAGTVIDVEQTPVGGIWLAFLRSSDMALAAQAVADGTGAYSLDLAAGTYFVFLIDPSQRHASGLAGAPDLVEVRPAQATAFDALVKPATGSITGTVRDALSGDPLEGAWAIALTAGGAPLVGAQTDSSGRFALTDLRPGGHRIAYLDPAATHRSAFYPGVGDVHQSLLIPVSAGDTAIADVSLSSQAAPVGSVVLEGAVTDGSSGEGIQGALVLALQASDFRFAGAVVTGSAGTFHAPLPSGSYHLAVLDPSGRHEMKWFDDHPYHALASADAVTLPAVANMTLTRRGGGIEGKVARVGVGTPVAGAWVLVIDAAGLVRGAVTDEAGAYSFTDVPAGTYRLAVLDAAGDGTLMYWQDAETYLEADAIAVAPPSDAVIDIDLQASGTERVLDSAIGHWNAATGLSPDGSLPDLSGQGNDMDLRTGFAPSYPPALVEPDPEMGRHLFSPGWDDMYMDTPDPSVSVTGVDVAWEGDLERVLEVAAWKDINWIVHQGSSADATFSWAVGILAATGQVVVRWSPDGTQVNSAVSEASFPPGAHRGAVVLDPETGDLNVYRQDIDAAREAFSSPYEGSPWVLVDSVEGAGPVALFDSDAPIRHSSAVPQDRLGDSSGEGWFKALYRLRVRDRPTGIAIAAFDVHLVPPEPEWFIEPNLPPLFPGGDPHEASTTEFLGAVGETWSIHNYRTSSFPMLFVDRPYVLFGNHNYGSMGVDDELFGLTTSRDLSVWIAYSYPRVGAGGGPFVALKDWSPSGASPGWMLLTSPYLGGPSAVVSDGVSVAYDPAPVASDGHINLSGFQVDAHSRTIQSVTNGATSAAPVSYSVLDSLFIPRQELTVAGYSDNAVQGPSFAFASLVIFDRTLTPDEISRLSAELEVTEP